MKSPRRGFRVGFFLTGRERKTCRGKRREKKKLFVQQKKKPYKERATENASAREGRLLLKNVMGMSKKNRREVVDKGEDESRGGSPPCRGKGGKQKTVKKEFPGGERPFTPNAWTIARGKKKIARETKNHLKGWGGQSSIS